MYDVLLIGQYKIRGDGWSECTRSLIKAIQTRPEIKLHICNINMANRPPTPETEFTHLETKLDKYDVVLQKVLPNLFHYDSHFGQNIGMCVFETELSKSHPYIYRISNLLDKVTVTNNLEYSWLSKITKTPVFPIGEAIDIKKYEKHFQPVHPIFQDASIFKFLCTAEATERKNLSALIKAYLTEFSFRDNVALVIKTSNDLGPEIEKIKNTLRKSNNHHYPIICLINGIISEDQMASLYQYSDCFVVPSKGESFCRGAAESIAAGKPVICTRDIGTGEFISNGGWLVDSRTESCYVEQPPVPELCTYQELWQDISILDLKRCLREAFSDKDLYKHICENIKNLDLAEQFSYEFVGNNLLKVIEA